MRYHVRQGVQSLREVGGRLVPGEILICRNGGIILHCPKCKAMQIVVEPLTGPPDRPTIQNPILCGGGYCKRCAAWFRIVRGQGEVLPDYEPETRDLPPELRAAGVDYLGPLKQ